MRETAPDPVTAPAKKPHGLQTTGALAPIAQDRLLDLAIAANRIAGNASGVNSYQVRKQLPTSKEKARVAV